MIDLIAAERDAIRAQRDLLALEVADLRGRLIAATYTFAESVARLVAEIKDLTERLERKP